MMQWALCWWWYNLTQTESLWIQEIFKLAHSVYVCVYCRYTKPSARSPVHLSNLSFRPQHCLSQPLAVSPVWLLLCYHESICVSHCSELFSVWVSCVVWTDFVFINSCNALTLDGLVLLSLLQSHCLCGAKPLNGYTSWAVCKNSG